MTSTDGLNNELVILGTEQQWLHQADFQMYGVTKEDIQKARADGFIKYYMGVKLILQRHLSDTSGYSLSNAKDVRSKPVVEREV